MRAFILCGLLAAMAGCGGDVTAPNPNAAVVGNYVLSQVNGVTPPMVYFQNGAGRIDILSGSMSLRSDLSYTQTVTDRITYTDGTPTQTLPIVENGTFSVTGTQITFTIPASGSSGALSYTGAASAGVVSYTYANDSYQFRRQ